MAKKVKLIINIPQTAIEGWTGYLKDETTGERIGLYSYCGGGRVAFNTKDALIKEAKKVARGLA